MGESRARKADLGFALLILAVSAIVWWGTAGLLPPKWEPLGSASVPRGIAAVMALLALALAGQAALALRRARPPRSDARAGGSAPNHWGRALATVVLTVLFVVVMQTGLLDFLWAATLFVALVTLTLAKPSLRGALMAIAFAILLVGLCDVVFTHVFYVDLP